MDELLTAYEIVGGVSIGLWSYIGKVTSVEGKRRIHRWQVLRRNKSFIDSSLPLATHHLPLCVITLHSLAEVLNPVTLPSVELEGFP
jgi:hypothetical protein